MHAPFFWKEKTPLSTALLPLAAIYGSLAVCRQRATHPQKLSVPVICIGNLVAGGAGKTPVAIALGEMLKAKGINAHYLSRGYKGKLRGPVRVDLANHTAADVGDEPLLLAEVLPTWVAKNRLTGAHAAIEAGAKLILMDDGFQNNSIHKDVSLLVIDGGYGFGNERMIPAGPMREPIASAMERASAVVLMGEDKNQVLRHCPPNKPIFRAHLNPLPAAQALKGKHVVAFAGIARPLKFYHTLQSLGCDVRKMVAYPDHYRLKPKNIAFLHSKAKEYEALLVTTTKDYVRLPPEMRAGITPVPIQVTFQDGAALLRMVMI